MNRTRLHDLWKSAQEQLAAAGVEQPRLDARLLIEHATGLDRSDIMLKPSRTLTDDQVQSITTLIDRRAKREPVARIIGMRGFWTLDLALGPDTLEPRPDTETLVDAVLGHLSKDTPAPRILDLGTGTGAILLSLLTDLPDATGVGTDISEGALQTAQQNADANGLASRVQFVQSDWAEGLADHAPFDVIVSNPPYIPAQDIAGLEPEVQNHDPRRALDGGADGLDAYRMICASLPQLAAPNALVAFEMGIGQSSDVASLMQAAGCENPVILRDFGDIERVVVARMPQ
ncbi:MAG: peptide chain release factor N(5)-glutamine methyltransferase [Alphaproteobacteria bacterium]